MKKILLVSFAVIFSIVSCKSASELPVQDKQPPASLPEPAVSPAESSVLPAETAVSEIPPETDEPAALPEPPTPAYLPPENFSQEDVPSGVLPDSAEPAADNAAAYAAAVDSTQPDLLLSDEPPQNVNPQEELPEANAALLSDSPDILTEEDPADYTAADNTLPPELFPSEALPENIPGIAEPEILPQSDQPPDFTPQGEMSDSPDMLTQEDPAGYTAAGSTLPADLLSSDTLPENIPPVSESAAAAETAAPVPETTVSDTPYAVPVPSRSVTVGLRQYLDVQYPGSGWIYLGEVEPDGADKKNPLMTYFGRQLNSTDTVFSLRSGKAGDTILHFYKPDQLTGEYIDDYLAVAVTDQPAQDVQRIKAPSYAQIVPSGQHTVPAAEENPPKDASSSGNEALQSGAAFPTQNAVPRRPSDMPQSSSVKDPAVRDSGISAVTVQPAQESDAQKAQPDTAALSVPAASAAVIPSDQLLKQAQSAYDEGEYEKAAGILDTFFASAGTDIDRGLFLKGQIYEAKSPIRNIRESIAAYSKLVQTYPQSPLWQQAKNRVTYLDRFYFNIR